MFADVDNGSTIAREEIFGPVLSVIPADSEEQAIELANDTIYGLNASVFTTDPERAYAVGRRLRAGTVGHNAFKTDFSIIALIGPRVASPTPATCSLRSMAPFHGHACIGNFSPCSFAQALAMS